MDEAKVLEDLLARNALRLEAKLPLLNVDRELQKACDLDAASEAGDRYAALCELHADERQRIRDEVINEAHASGNHAFPSGWSGNYWLSTVVDRKFREFLSTIQDNS